MSTNQTLAELEAQYGTIYTIKATTEAGQDVEMYLRKPDSKLKKAAIETLMTDQTAIIAAGEMILLGCNVGGYDMYADEDLRIEAAVAASELAKFNTTVQLKKN